MGSLQPTPRYRYAHPYEGADMQWVIGPEGNVLHADLDALTRDDRPQFMAWLFARMRRVGDANTHRPTDRPRWTISVVDADIETIRALIEMILTKRDCSCPLSAEGERLRRLWGLHRAPDNTVR